MVLADEPDHYALSQNPIEYEFTASGGRNWDERTHQDGMRVFRGRYAERGPYRAQSVPSGGLVWNGQPLIWGGDYLNWDGD